jgi:penicillin V acylase-like amidase (Ntn superfamily)
MRLSLEKRMNTCVKLLLIHCACTLLLSAPVYGCTVFLLKDADASLFCNNEDWTDPKTRIWFMPADENASNSATYGRAFVGFSNQWGQGGVNTAGLAYDWVAGFDEAWERKQNPHLEHIKGNPAERMLESCGTVEEAVAFFNTYWEPSFSYAKILVADRSGRSAVIGAKDNRLEISLLNKSRGFGVGIGNIEHILDEGPDPALQIASSLLQKAAQEEWTKYSNVFDLHTGDIYFVYRFPDNTKQVKLNLHDELEKGAHRYDIPKIEEQLNKKATPVSGFKEWVKNRF